MTDIRDEVAAALRRRAIDDLYAVFAPDVVLEAEVEAVIARIVAIDARGLTVVREGERYGWHANGDLCLGAECSNIDENTGDHSSDVHSDDWWEGFAEHGRRVVREKELDAAYQKGWQHGRQAAPRELDVGRLAGAITVAGITDPQDGIPAYRWDLYAGTVAKALAAEYARLARQPEGQ